MPITADAYDGWSVKRTTDELNKMPAKIRAAQEALDAAKKWGDRVGDGWSGNPGQREIAEAEKTLRNLQDEEAALREAQKAKTPKRSALPSPQKFWGPSAADVQKWMLNGVLFLGVCAGIYFGGAAFLAALSAMAGPSLLTASPAQTPDPRKEVRPETGPTDIDHQPVWQVVKVPNMGGYGGTGIYSIRLVSDIEHGIPHAAFRHAGNGGDPVKDLERIGSPGTRAEAAQGLAGMIEAGSFRIPPLAGGMWARIGGKLVTIDDFGPVSIREVQAAMPKQ